MKKYKLISTGLAIVILSSCATLNTIDFTDAHPSGKGSGNIVIGAISSVNFNSDTVAKKIIVNHTPQYLGSLLLKGNVGLGEHVDLTAGVSLPYVIGGVGVQLGGKYALLKKESNFNIALGISGFGSFSKDSIKIGGSKQSINQYKSQNFSFITKLPISYKTSDDLMFTLMPQFAINNYVVTDARKISKEGKFNFNSASLILAIQYKQVIFSGGYTTILNENINYPMFGIAIKPKFN